MTTPALPPDWCAHIATLPPDGGPSGQEWLRGLPRLVDEQLASWRLTPIGPVRTGHTAVVVPVVRAQDPEPLALKLIWPHPEAAAEHLALRHWAGAGAVRLVAADPRRGALLLEALDADRSLQHTDDEHACATIGDLLRRLHVPAPPTVPSAVEFVQGHLDKARAARTAGRLAIPPRLLDRAGRLLDDLAPSAGHTLLHTDLHYANVLAVRPAGDATRGPWLAIDPKPMAGHPGLDLQPVLRNRTAELGTGAALRWGLRDRLARVCDAAGIDVDAARAWTIVHATLDAVWATEERDRSLAVATTKAMED